MPGTLETHGGSSIEERVVDKACIWCGLIVAQRKIVVEEKLGASILGDKFRYNEVRSSEWLETSDSRIPCTKSPHGKHELG